MDASSFPSDVDMLSRDDLDLEFLLLDSSGPAGEKRDIVSRPGALGASLTDDLDLSGILPAIKPVCAMGNPIMELNGPMSESNAQLVSVAPLQNALDDPLELGSLDAAEIAEPVDESLLPCSLRQQLFVEPVEIKMEDEDSEQRKARRRMQDAINARHKRTRKKNEMMELRKQVNALNNNLEGLRLKRKLLSCDGQVAEWEERAMAQRHKRRQAEEMNEQLKRALFMHRDFLRDFTSAFTFSPVLTSVLNMRSLLHTFVRLGKDPRSRLRDFKTMCASSKLDLAIEILTRETKSISFDAPNITVQTIQTNSNEFGMTTTSVYALDTVDIKQIFVAACSAILSCELDWPNYTLMNTQAKVVDSPATHIRYGLSDTKYKSDATGEELLLEGRAVSYYRITDKYAVLLWDFVDTDDLYPLKDETDMKRDVIGSVVVRKELCEDGVERVVCRKICTKIHSLVKPGMSRDIMRFRQHRVLSAQAHGSWVYKQINSSVSRPISA